MVQQELNPRFSFVELLNGPLSPNSLSWVQAQAESNPSGGVDLILPLGDSESIGSTSFSSYSSSDSCRSSSPSESNEDMPDLGVWGIGAQTNTISTNCDVPLNCLPTIQQGQEIPSPPSQKKRKPVDRNTDKYKMRRERNNVSVRKSRAKAKSKIRKMEDRFQALQEDNRQLKLKFLKVRKLFSELESSFLGWKNILRDVEEEFSAPSLNLNMNN